MTGFYYLFLFTCTLNQSLILIFSSIIYVIIFNRINKCEHDCNNYASDLLIHSFNNRTLLTSNKCITSSGINMAAVIINRNFGRQRIVSFPGLWCATVYAKVGK